MSTKTKPAAPKRNPAKGRPSHPAMTPERIAELRKLAKKIDREEKEDLIRTGNAIMDRYDQTMSILQALRTEREAQGLSLSDIAIQVGGGRENLARLERGRGVNPTVNTLFRYAEALGKRLEIKLR